MGMNILSPIVIGSVITVSVAVIVVVLLVSGDKD